jgi:hypothetical protein
MFAQSDRGTITGTVKDPAGAVVPSAPITVKNTETGAVFEAATTATGNYTITQVPAGIYELTAGAAGFSKYIQEGITVQTAQVLRIDVVLQVGSTQESVTVTADAPLLRTESAEQSTNITMSQVGELPMYGVRPGDSGIRSPYAALNIMPGSTNVNTSSGNNYVRVNGLPIDTYSAKVEGQEATDSYSPQYPTGTQPGVDALQEITFQTSNFSAEYGQVGGGLINFTAKSGTNQLHGNLFEYLNNEDLNAGVPFTNNGNGGHSRPMTRVSDYGGSIGGPVYIPHVYDGRNKTFFFFNIERTPSSSSGSSSFRTVPTLAFRNGDFSSILTGKTLNTDPLGNQIKENAIYDPATLSLAPNGQPIEQMFPGNIIPISRMDPVALKIQALIPMPTLGTMLVNNWMATSANAAQTGISALNTFKADENLTEKSKVSFYLSWRTSSGQSIRPGYGYDGMPSMISNGRDGALDTPTVRLNYDHIFTPTTLLHVGLGFIRHLQPDVALLGARDYDAPGQLGLVGGIVNTLGGQPPATGFPRINGLSNAWGGFDTNLGPTNVNYYYMEKPTAVASLNHVYANHSLKFGAEWRKEAFTDRNDRGGQGIWNFSTNETALPSTNGQNLNGGTTGFPWASFLLGGADSASVNTPEDPQVRKVMFGTYAQDTWKITPKITLDYGLRWDFQTALAELYNRLAEFSPSVVNPSAGNLLGGMVYAGTGPGRVGGQFTKNYPYAFGPRLGVAWQLAPKTVLRAGVGVTYSQTGSYNWITNTPIVGVGWNNLQFTSTSFGQPAANLRTGLQYSPSALYAVSLNPGLFPTAPNQIQAPPYWLDPNGGRPGRILQWSIALQRQLTTNLSLEAAYVGNRSVWDQVGSAQDNLNALTPARIAAAGLNINSAADQSLLNSRLDSALAISRGFGVGPYAGYPTSTTVAQSLRPYPQFPTIPVLWSPLGNGWYDSLQTKLLKRFSHGLDVISTFTFQKELSIGEGPANDVFNRPVQKTISPYDLPFVLAIAINYRTPKWGPNRWMRAATGDWTIGTVLRYQSGFPILVPAANNSLSSLLFQSTNVNRVPGVPLFTQDLNCHCFDPNKQFVLNPAAWTQPAAGQFGTAADYYNDYRSFRRPNEEISFGRAIRIREGMSLDLRAMFYNMFNRTYMADPTSTNSQATQTYGPNGLASGGFGWINTGSTFYWGARSGRLQARFVF